MLAAFVARGIEQPPRSAGFRPALWVCVGFAVLAAVAGSLTTSPRAGSARAGSAGGAFVVETEGALR